MTIPISSSANSHHSIPVHFTQPGFYSINTTPLMTSGSAILFPTIPSQRTIGTVGAATVMVNQFAFPNMISTGPMGCSLIPMLVPTTSLPQQPQQQLFQPFLNHSSPYPQVEIPNPEFITFVPPSLYSPFDSLNSSEEIFHSRGLCTSPLQFNSNNVAAIDVENNN